MITIIIGALFRRFWGGWLAPPDWLRKAAILPVCYLCAFMVLHNQPLAIFTAAVQSYALWNTNYGNDWRHGWAQYMGSDAAHPIGRCILIFWTIYGLPMALIGLVWWLDMHSYAALLYPLFGFLTPLPYWLAHTFKADLILKDEPAAFINNPTCLGELGLGAIIIGGTAVAVSIMNLL